MIATTMAIIYAPRRFQNQRGPYRGPPRSMRQSLARYCFYLVFYPYAGVVELADTPDLGSGAARFGGSSPPSRITGHIVLAERL